MRLPVLFLICLLAARVWGQPVGAERREEVYALPPVAVEGQRAETGQDLTMDTTVTVAREGLLAGAARSLGEALEGVAGVGNSSFGPAVGQPTIRGYSGQRVRVLSNGLGTGDASAVSPDHAVALDARFIEAIRIIRGPASLFYGSGAVGGAVDAETIIVPTDGGGEEAWRGEAVYDSATEGALGFISWEEGAGAGRLALNILGRRAEDLHIPGKARRTDVQLGHSHGNSALTEEPNPAGTLPNSHQRTWTGSIGYARRWENLRVGLGGVWHENQYGVPFHSHADSTDSQTRDVNSAEIDLRQARGLAEVDIEPIWGFSTHFRGGYTDYTHTEEERNRPASRFDIKTEEARLELVREGKNASVALGLQAGRERFASPTQEDSGGFVFPATTDAQGGLFGVATGNWGAWEASVAGRFEVHRLRLTDLSGYARTYRVPTYAVGVGRQLPAGLRVGASHTWMERAPSAGELFANGGHVATGIFERGSLFQFPSGYFASERGRSVEGFASWLGAYGEFQITVYQQAYDRFIFLQRSAFTDDSSGLPIFDYRQAPSDRRGLEVTVRIGGKPWGLAAWSAEAGFDRVEATFDRAADGKASPLPRTPPWRGWGGIEFSENGWTARTRVTHWAEQDEVDLNSETATPAFTRWDIGVGRSWSTHGSEVSLNVTIRNVLDREGRNHLSFLKDVAPEPGRDVVVSLEVRY